MKIKKSILLIAMGILLVLIQACTTKSIAAVSSANLPINPWDYQKQLGKGLDVDWFKTKDGMEYYNSKTVEDFKANGINNVRIRIKDDVSDELLKQLDNQIQDCLNNNIIPIIAYQADDFKNAPTDKNMNKVIDWWTKASEHYKSYSNLLSFDLIIEVTDELNKEPDTLNEAYEKIVSAIRVSNPNRIIMISPVVRSNPENLSKLKIPSASNGYLMAEWHFYASGPSKTNKEKLWTTGTEEEKKLITDKINCALQWQKANNIPTWVGAWMPGDYNDGNNYTVDEQVTFAKFMTKSLSDAQIPFDVNSDTKFYDRENNKWIEDMQPVFKAIFLTSNANDKAQALMLNGQEISVGFNTKATLSSMQQCSYIRNEFNKLKNEGIKTNKIWLRLNGGTISQKTKPNDWTEDMIKQWGQIQKDFGCNYVFVVNYNDTPKSQFELYNRLTKGGIKFNAIELGNEQYLGKYSEANTQKYDEVSERTSNMTPEKYIKICNEYILDFNSEALPFYVQFAPQKEGKVEYTEWNKSIANAINLGKFQTKNIYGSIHMYERDGDGSLDEKQINAIRSLMINPINFAVTESGVINSKANLSYEQHIKQEENLTQRILKELKGGDLFFNQVLYTDYKDVNAEVLHQKYNGITPKGEAIMEIFKKYW